MQARIEYVGLELRCSNCKVLIKETDDKCWKCSAELTEITWPETRKHETLREKNGYSTQADNDQVVVTDIKMRFLSMVLFMVKWVIASIPAFIILVIIITIAAAILGAVFGGIFSALF